MVEEKNDTRELNLRQMLPWTELFRGFQVAIDPKKLLLAAAGIVVMSVGWYILQLDLLVSKARPEQFQPQQLYP